MNNHTPTPWTARGISESGDIDISANFRNGKHGGSVGDLVATVSCGLNSTQAANAEFIVSAVNLHDELLAACRTALYNLVPVCASDHFVMMRLRKAIEKAVGHE